MIVVIGPKFFGYCEAIVQCFRETGLSAEYLDELPNNNSMFKMLIRIFPGLGEKISSKYHAALLERINKDLQISKVIYISTESITKSFVEGLREDITQIGYAWDSIKNKPTFRAVLDSVDTAASFDPADCQNYGYKYVPLFAENMFKNANMHRGFHFSLVGSAHTERSKIADTIDKIKDVKSFLYLYSPNILVFLFRNKNNFLKGLKTLKTKSLYKERVAEVFKSTRFVVDFAHPGQSGLTQRTFEAIRSGAILVTNNKTSLPFEKMKNHVIYFESWDPLEFQNIVSLDKGSIVLDAELDYLLSIDRFCNQILEPSSEL